MAKMYGSAAGGAVKQALDSATARLAPPEPPRQYRDELTNPNAVTPSPNGWVFIVLMTWVAFFSVKDGQPLFVSVALFATIPVIYWFSVKEHRRETTRIPIDYAESHPEYAQQLEAVKQRVHDDFQKVLDTGKTKGTVFEGGDQSWASGAAGEIHTSWLLQDGLDDTFEVWEDLEINKNGRTTANIDHLVSTARGSILIDTKVWNRKPEFVQTDLGVIIPKQNFASGAVSTCIYEASLLPGPVRAIVFAVRGAAASKLKQPVQVHLYHERFDSSNAAHACPMPVLFIDQAQIAPTIAALDAQLPAMAPVATGTFSTTGHSAA